MITIQANPPMGGGGGTKVAVGLTGAGLVPTHKRQGEKCHTKAIILIFSINLPPIFKCYLVALN